MKFRTEQELLEYTSNIKGKTFKEIDSENLLANASLNRQKGLLGHVVETGFYKYPINSDSKADFEELDIELKVTGYVKNKNGSLRAKERLVLSKINYNEIINETFESSHVLGKCKKMLIIWYEYDSTKEAKDFLITDYQLYDMTNDFKIFNNDFEIIKGKVLDGRAHELSEGDTSYLGACTKARTSSDRTTQPFSDILPKPRAYSLKNAYMTGILRELIEKPTLLEIKSQQEFNTVIEYVKDKLEAYFGKTQVEILEEITGREYDEIIPKNISKMISDELIGKDEDLPKKDDLFAKTSFIIKNLPIKEDGKPRERMSFKTISLSDFETDWEDSYWKNYFEETTLIVICYAEKNKSRNGFRVLSDVKQITFDENDLESFEKTYNQIKLAIEKKDVNLLPTSANGFKNQLLEIAPKGVKGDDAYVNFFKRDKTKVAFMISKKLLVNKLNI
ncbi:MAG: hypothetical protein IJH65_10255 [Methanobrevibacter sp.]|nr:hypothetical protein [Methanobrevibacter sp.]